MKRRIGPLLLALGLLLPATPVLAASDATHFSFNGQIAFASFASVDPSGCIVTGVNVVAVDGSIKVDGQPPIASETSVQIQVDDVCTGDTLFAGSASAALANGAFVVRKLDSATLDGSIDVFDKTSGSTVAVHLSLNWTGVGDQTRTKDHLQIIEPGFVLISQSDASLRDATASGTVSVGTTNFAPDAADSASLADVRSGEVSIVKI
jgi:hypothetical protein